MTNQFKFGTYGHAIQANLIALRTMRDHLRGMNLADGSAHHQEAVEAIGKIIVRMNYSVEQEVLNHPDTLTDDYAMRERVFIGTFPTGISYADRLREVSGDYKRLAFLPFQTLVLEVEKDCPADLRAFIEADAATIQARRGQQFQVSTSGQTVTLGK